MRTLAEIRADILALEAQTEGLMHEILGQEPRPTGSNLRVYADTSVMGGCEDAEFRAECRRLFDAFRTGRAILVLSDLTLRELAGAPLRVREVLADVPRENTELLYVTEQAQTLAAA